MAPTLPRLLAAAGLALLLQAPAWAQPIKIANIVELSGAGATSGTNFKDGVLLAVKEINAAGGILGRKIETSTADTQSNPGVAKGLAQKAVDDGVVAVFGPVFSGSIMVSMAETRRAELPNFTGGEAAAITKQGNPYIFRTSFTQDTAMPKIARYIASNLKAKSVALIYVNNDYGKGGRESLMKALEPLGVKVTADISTDQNQVDFSAPVLKAKQSNADIVFVYTNEEESARALRELRKQGVSKPIVGETTLVGQKVIELAGDAANGAVAHVGLTVDAPMPAMRAFRARFEKEYRYTPDHNGIKGYTGVYVLKAAIEKAGKVDRKAIAQAMHGLSVAVAKEQNVILDVAFDNNGDLDRDSFLVEVRGGKQEIKEILPALGRK
ncbi:MULTISPECIES: ABC transporter substrate-binding protein [Ramlibacter]|uniref:ABC transporter substrate-binding protein n=1 Tax=Ramlibacter pinisoli TaxID=2682844 RepID=A0A6N8IVS1_9BURK|nr:MULTISPECIES: ABC transporter substrate-binding protein [Ramlibacter]MBA2961110.1 ABC transporter substrate-binding protein [Ramlibacter sp. CGMCC 1.13660]MVQ31054.1 ABC transporter substrate-binding protein [Ramlibacter pinisoli]